MNFVTSNCPSEPDGATPERSAFNLTDRERQIVGLLVKGLRSQQIANCLGLRFYTVTTHLKNIHKKLGVHNRAQVVVKVLAKGMGKIRRRASSLAVR